jgi:multiple sugar transport system substrate-binding protein
MKLKRVSVIFVGLALLLSVVAIGYAQVTVKMVYWPGPEADAMQEVVNWYNENVTPTSGVNVEMVLFGRDGFFEREATLLAAGSSEVDMIFTTSYIVNEHAPFLDDLYPYFADPTLCGDGDPDILIPTAKESLVVDGELKGIVMDGSINLLLYRKDLVQELLTNASWQQTYREIARRELGRDLLPKPADEWTWDDFLATGLFFSKSQNPDSPTTYATALQAKAMWPNGKIWSAVLKSCGGSWFVDDEPSFNTPVGVRAMNVYRQLVEKGGTSPQCITYEYMEPNEAMRTGQAAMILQWGVAYVELTDKENSPLIWDKIGVAPHPAGDVEHTVWLTSMGVGLSKYSPNKEAAFKWLSFLATIEAQRMYGMNGGIPAVQTVLEELSEKNAIYGYVSDYLAKYAFFETAGPKTVGVLRIIAEKISSAAALDLTAEEAVAAIDREVKQLMEE